MNKFSFRFLILVFCVLFAANSAFAWDEVGHKLSAYIAWERMTPEVRGKVVKILLDAPEDSDLSVLYDAYNSRSKAIKERELFMYAAIWSDVVRNRDFEVRYKNYNQGDWHYAGIFWKQENGEALILPGFPVESGKAIPKLYDFEKILRDSSYPNKEKSIALAWFLHVGGDIHNPVHNASRITEVEPKGDQGGNLFILQKLQKPSGEQRGTNLHAYWDGIIGNVIPRKNDACDSDYLAPIARDIMKKYPYSKMQNRLELGDYKKWNLEGFDFLNKVVYKDITREQIPSEQYRKRAFDVASEQISLAGYRLGETLNRIFEKDGKVADKQIIKPLENKNLSGQEAMAIWDKVKSVIDNTQPFKFIRVDIRNTTVTLNGIIASAALKKEAVKAVESVEGVTKVFDNLIVDENISPETADNEVKMSRTIPAQTVSKTDSECKIIRKILYPVSEIRKPEQKMRIALLDICPPNRGMIARPTIAVSIIGSSFTLYEYDVVRFFETEKEAKEYAEENSIKDVNYK